MAKPTQDSAIKRIVRTPMFRQRVENDKTKYHWASAKRSREFAQ